MKKNVAALALVASLAAGGGFLAGSANGQAPRPITTRIDLMLDEKNNPIASVHQRREPEVPGEVTDRIVCSPDVFELVLKACPMIEQPKE